MNNFTLEPSNVKVPSSEVAYGIVNEAFDFFDDENEDYPMEEEKREEDIDEEMDDLTTEATTVIENNKNVKIVEIKSHDIVQGILSLEPSIPISSGEHSSKSPKVNFLKLLNFKLDFN